MSLGPFLFSFTSIKRHSTIIHDTGQWAGVYSTLIRLTRCHGRPSINAWSYYTVEFDLTALIKLLGLRRQSGKGSAAERR